MACNKKRLLLLLAIPCYCVIHFTWKLVLDYQFQNSDIVCFSAFIVCASVILATDSKIARAVCLSLTSVSLVLMSIFETPFITLTARDLLIYGIFEVPALVLLIMITDKKQESIAAPPADADEPMTQQSKQGIKRFLNYRIFYKALLFVLLIVLLMCLATRKEHIVPAAKVTTSLACFLGLFIILSFCCLILYSKNDFHGSKPMEYTVRLWQTCVFYLLVDIFWANSHNQNTVYLCLPLILSLIFVFKHFNVFGNVKSIVLEKTGKKKR